MDFSFSALTRSSSIMSSSGSSHSAAKIQYVQDPEGSEGADADGNGSGRDVIRSNSNLSVYGKDIKDNESGDANSNSGGYNNKTCLYQSGREPQFDVSVLSSIVSGIAKALSGDSVVTAPALSRGYDWLGRVIIKPGPLEGPYYRRHRTYRVQGQILAGGHVLPWRIGRSWRYSELHALLFDDLSRLVYKFSLQPHYSELMTHFPPKDWQGRNSDQTAKFRGAAIEAYVLRGIEITSMLLDSIPAENRLTRKQRERNKQRQRQRRRQRQLQRELGGNGGRNSNTNTDTDGASANPSSQAQQDYYIEEDSDSDASEPKCADEMESELKQIMNIFVTKLLGIDKELINHLTQISNDLGKLISATPSTHSRVSKDFRVDPQQAL